MTFIFSLFIMSLFNACSARSISSADNLLPPKTLTNVAYGADSMQRMDIHLPANRSTDSTKVLVLIHGGGWASGDKSEFGVAIHILQKKLPDYAIFNINYRLATQTANHFPTQEEDLKSAIQFILRNRDEYGVSKKIVLLGASAGGHLALLQAYKHQNIIAPAAVVSFFGPADMADMYNKQANAYYKYGLQLLVGGTPAAKPELFKSVSPLNFVTDKSAATIIFHGEKDRLVPLAQSQALKKKLDFNGVPSELVIYPTEGHGWWGSLLESSFEKAAQFLNLYVE